MTNESSYESSWVKIPENTEIPNLGITDERRKLGFVFSAKLSEDGISMVDIQEHYNGKSHTKGGSYSIPSITPDGQEILDVLAKNTETKKKAEEILEKVRATIGRHKYVIDYEFTIRNS